MATTTNYGWTTPDDTALVKDGAAAIRTLGSSVDTTTKALNPSTTLGDIEYRSSTANTNTRLGIGTTGQVLAVSGGVPAWTSISSGGLTLLSTTTLSGTSTTISSISGDYTNLQIVYLNVLGSANGSLLARFNGDDAGNYFNCQMTFNTYEANANATATSLAIGAISNNSAATETYSGTITIPRYTTGTSKFVQSWSIGKYASFSPDARLLLSNYGSSSAISSITFLTGSATTFSAGTIYIYGAK